MCQETGDHWHSFSEHEMVAKLAWQDTCCTHFTIELWCPAFVAYRARCYLTDLANLELSHGLKDWHPLVEVQTRLSAQNFSKNTDYVTVAQDTRCSYPDLQHVGAFKQ